MGLKAHHSPLEGTLPSSTGCALHVAAFLRALPQRRSQRSHEVCPPHNGWRPLSQPRHVMTAHEESKCRSKD